MAGKSNRTQKESKSKAHGGHSAAHSETSASSKTTTDHDVIRHWTEQRGGVPACVKGTGGNDDVGMIRLEFPGTPGNREDSLQEISWEDFFQKFDESNLALVYQETTAEGAKSNFNKLIKRESAQSARAGS